ncbi:MAG TPA: hypothetical protein IAB65_06460 [Candidatus Onthocola stercorigallinarum]|nr:hypothetical protein [Candidatus Onthocola stercorigallinarum]
MAILKSEIRNKYSQIPNSVIRANDISDGDYRLLIYLYSLPDGWKINQSYLGTELGCNRRNINSKIKRLKDAGYLELIKATNNKETDYIYVLKEKCESPSDESINNSESSSDASVNDTYINTNIINTENKDNINNIFSTQKKESKKNYGDYKRIKLTDKEYQKLCEDYGKERLDEQIKLLDEYVESNNNKNKYTNFNLVLRKSFRENWFKKNQSKKDKTREFLDKEMERIRSKSE